MVAFDTAKVERALRGPLGGIAIATAIILNA